MVLAADPHTLLQHAVYATLGEILTSHQRSETAIHKTADQAADGDTAVGPAVGVVVELRRRTRRISPDVNPGIPHPPDTVAQVAGDGTGRDLGLRVSVDEDPMAAVVLDGVREDLCGGASVHLNSLRSIVLNHVRRADSVVGRAHPSDASARVRLDSDPGQR